MLRGDSPTILELQEILYQVLHESVLLRHVALEVDHLREHALVVRLERADVRSHLFLIAGHTVDLRLQRLDGRA